MYQLSELEGLNSQYKLIFRILVFKAQTPTTDSNAISTALLPDPSIKKIFQIPLLYFSCIYIRRICNDANLIFTVITLDALFGIEQWNSIELSNTQLKQGTWKGVLWKDSRTIPCKTAICLFLVFLCVDKENITRVYFYCTWRRWENVSDETCKQQKHGGV